MRNSIKRYPWMSREDAEALRALPLEQARKYENFLLAQARSDRRFREQEVSETTLGGEAVLESVLAKRVMRTGHRPERHKPAE